MKKAAILWEVLGWAAVAAGLFCFLVALQGSFTAGVGFTWDPLSLLPLFVGIACVGVGGRAIRRARLRRRRLRPERVSPTDSA